MNTDIGNAELFVHEHGDGVRYDHRFKRWLMWSKAGHRWQPDLSARVERLIQQTMRARLLRLVKENGFGDDGSGKLGWAKRSESAKLIQAALRLARSREPVADEGAEWDREPNLLCCRNGILDLRSGKLRDGRPEDRITLSARVTYDPKATASRWGRFLDDTFPGDPDLIAWLQRALGYSLTGEVSEMVWFLKYGAGRNGKGVIDRVVLDLIGSRGYGRVLPFTALTHESTITEDIADLYKTRYAMASEGRKRSQLNEARMKSLTGGDPLTANRKFGHNFTFDPSHKLWVSTNARPAVTDTSFAFWNRVRVIEFAETFKPNGELEPALRREREGIFAWLVRGAIEWYREGMGATPSKVAAATRQYEEESDNVFKFVQEWCSIDPQGVVGAQDLYDAFHRWEVRNNVPRIEWVSHNDFGAAMKARFVKKPTNRGFVYFGISLKPDALPTAGAGSEPE